MRTGQTSNAAHRTLLSRSPRSFGPSGSCPPRAPLSAAGSSARLSLLSPPPDPPNLSSAPRGSRRRDDISEVRPALGVSVSQHAITSRGSTEGGACAPRQDTKNASNARRRALYGVFPPFSPRPSNAGQITDEYHRSSAAGTRTGPAAAAVQKHGARGAAPRRRRRRGREGAWGACAESERPARLRRSCK